MASNSRRLAILQADERTISALLVNRSSRGLEIAGHAVQRGVWSRDDGTLSAALRGFAREQHLGRAACYFILPRYEATARIISLPSHDQNEVAGMVRLCAEEYTPYRAEELVTGQCILQRLNTGESTVLAVFAQQTVVDAYVSLLEQAGIEPEAIFFSTACLASAAIAARPASQGPYALVNLASGGLEVLVLNGAHVEHARGVAAPHDWTLGDGQAGEALDELSTEVRASLSSHRRESEDGSGVQEVYICSDWADVEAARSALEGELGQPCLKAEFGLRAVTKGAEHLTSSPLPALGAALAAQDRAALDVRLESAVLRSRRRRAAARRYVLQTGGVFALVIACLVGLYVQAVYQRRSYLAELESEIAGIRPQARDLIEKQRQLGIIEQQIDRSGSVLEALAALSEVAPRNRVNIKRFQFERGKSITIEGRALSDSAPYDFAEDLREAGRDRFPPFSQARVAGSTRDQEQNTEVWNYRIEMPFPQLEDEAAPAPGEEAP